jgi:hypothetical protein
VCCNQVCLGTCQACSAALTGGANGVCDDVSNGVSDPPGCASPSTCNGSGQCSQAQGTACSDPGNCASGFCVDGFCCDTTCDQTCEACSAAKKGSGTDGVCGDIAAATDPDSECTGSSTCDGLGGCSNPNGSACITSGECDSGFCVDTVCCNTACTGVCEGCNLAAHVGTCTLVPSGLDDADTCTPTSTRDCNGAGLCLDTEGQPCTTAGECASGFCVDGFCCNTACSGTCEACSAAKKGSGSDGTCGAISPGSDPDNECTGASCNGAGACRLPNGQICGTGTECESTLCIDGVCCNTACSSTCQACNLAGSPGTCTNVPANTDPGNECAGGDCNGAGACEQANGAACSQPTQCISGFCVDGFCCDTACNALCQACSATLKGSGANGTCGLIAPGTDPQNECPGTNDCDITGGCSP